MTKPTKTHEPHAAAHVPAHEPHAPSKESFGLLIDKGVPIPRSRGGISAHPYPFDKMEIDDSIFIERGEKTVNISNVKSAAQKRVPGAKFITRKVEEPVLDEAGQPTGDVRKGFRIWRTH